MLLDFSDLTRTGIANMIEIAEPNLGSTQVIFTPLPLPHAHAYVKELLFSSLPSQYQLKV